MHSGGYGAPVFGIGVLDGEIGYTSGGRGGWVVNHVFVIGGYGQNLTVVDAAGREKRVTGGGLFLEGILGYRSPVHATLEAGFGFGSVAVDARETPAFVPYGAARLELNLTDWMHFTTGPSVRYVAAQAERVPGAPDALAFGGEALIKFGWF